MLSRQLAGKAGQKLRRERHGLWSVVAPVTPEDRVTRLRGVVVGVAIVRIGSLGHERLPGPFALYP